MDDLLLVISYDKKSFSSYQQALQWKKTFLRKNGARVYRGGLELEEQTEMYQDKNKSCYEFAGTVVTFEREKGNFLFYCKTWNKNEGNLLEKGKQKIPRYVTRHSMVPEHYKLGMQSIDYKI